MLKSCSLPCYGKRRIDGSGSIRRHIMRYLMIALLLALVLTNPIVARTISQPVSPDHNPAIQNADVPETLLDGIDWDEWLEGVTNPDIDWFSLFGYWNMLDGIDWDEWLENIGLGPTGGLG